MKHVILSLLLIFTTLANAKTNNEVVPYTSNDQIKYFLQAMEMSQTERNFSILGLHGAIVVNCSLETFGLAMGGIFGLLSTVIIDTVVAPVRAVSDDQQYAYVAEVLSDLEDTASNMFTQRIDGSVAKGSCVYYSMKLALAELADETVCLNQHSKEYCKNRMNPAGNMSL